VHLIAESGHQTHTIIRSPRQAPDNSKKHSEREEGSGLMERVCFLARVRPERLDEYRERHTSVWPEMLAALAKTGWGNYSIFLAEDGLLVGYLETADYQAALVAINWR
jgi:hypothetical protein